MRIGQPEWKATHWVRFFTEGDKPASVVEVMAWGGAEFYSEQTWKAMSPADFRFDRASNTYTVAGQIIDRFGDRNFEMWPIRDVPTP